MKKRFFKVLAVVMLMMSMSLTVMAAGSIVGALDRPNTSATDKNGNPVVVVVGDAKGYEESVQQAVDAMNNAKPDTTVGAVLAGIPGIDLSQIDRYDEGNVVEEHVDLYAYKFLTQVFDISFQGTVPSASNPVKVKFTVAMADNMIVDALHYCEEHGWEVLTGTKISNNELEAEFHSASPVALIYKIKPAGSSGSSSSGSAGVTSPKTADVSVVPMMAASVSMAAASVVAWKKGRKND